MALCLIGAIRILELGCAGIGHHDSAAVQSAISATDHTLAATQSAIRVISIFAVYHRLQ